MAGRDIIMYSSEAQGLGSTQAKHLEDFLCRLPLLGKKISKIADPAMFAHARGVSSLRA